MGLKDLRLPQEVIVTPGGALTVRGLDLPAIMVLVRNHTVPVATIFEKIMAGGNELNLDVNDVQALGMLLLTDAPQCVAEMIALADVDTIGAPDEESIASAMRLPFPVQFEAIEKIGRLTFTADLTPKKVLELVIRGWASSRELVESLQGTSKSG